jgi:oligopeptide/dipeptide ABC transporter ATP-binding protein
MARQPLLSVEDLRVEFWTQRGTVHAVNGISFDIAPGETLGIVGESGCGKSVTSLALLGILARNGRVTKGTATFGGSDLLKLNDAQLRTIRGREIGMIFQDPMTSLNPVLTIGKQIREPLEAHFGRNRQQADKRAVELFDQVGIPSAKQRLRDYPHQFSGGMRQRAMIAIALACEPKLLDRRRADDGARRDDPGADPRGAEGPRRRARHRPDPDITHDLGVVAGMCERVNVMYAGMFMETGTASRLFAQPRHPYTLGLLQSVPRIDAGRRQELQPIPGSPRNMLSAPAECPFAPRCRYEVEQSRQAVPPLEPIEPGHDVRCFNPVPADEWQRARLGGAA